MKDFVPLAVETGVFGVNDEVVIRVRKEMTMVKRDLSQNATATKKGEKREKK